MKLTTIKRLKEIVAAAATTVNIDGTDITMWGFAEGSGPVTIPGPRITVPAGEGLTINLTNELLVPVPSMIPGQAMPGTSTGTPGPTRSTVPGDSTLRIYSFVHETAPGETRDYVRDTIKPGTYLYHSGTHPAVQVQMGLYGAVTKNAVEAIGVDPAQAYPGRSYTDEAVIIYSEIDPLLHEAVAGGRTARSTTPAPSTTRAAP